MVTNTTDGVKIYTNENYSYGRKNIKKIILNITGFSYYEKNILNLIRLGKEKKAMKYGKKRLGNVKRAKKKKEMLNAFMRSKKDF
jgi:large subunit ribosomal protein L36e